MTPDFKEINKELDAAQKAFQSQLRIIDGMIASMPEDLQEWKNKFLDKRRELNSAVNKKDSSLIFPIIADVMKIQQDYAKAVSSRT